MMHIARSHKSIDPCGQSCSHSRFFFRLSYSVCFMFHLCFSLKIACFKQPKPSK